MLCTLMKPTAGRALVAGHDVVRERDDVRRHIGLVFQDPTLDGYLTAEQNLRLHAELYGVDPALVPGRMHQVLEMVGLWERRDATVMTFSGGMRRRLEIARGLLHSPRVLFLDEPTIGLDPQTRGSIWSYIAQLQQREEITIFMTTHYMDEAEFCDRIAIMDQGQIVALDTPEALKAQVGADRVRIETEDDDAAIATLAERFGLEATHVRGGRDLLRALRRGVRAAAVRRARRRHRLGQRLAADARRRLHVAHRHDDPRRRGVRQQARQPGDDADDVRGSPMSATEQAVATGAAAPAGEVIRVSVPPRSWRSELRAIKIVWRRELIRFRSDRMRIVTALVQPLLFLFVLGSGLEQLSAASTHGVELKTFIYPGVLCIAVMFTAMFSAASIVWDREFGFLREMMVAPVRRSSIVIGKCFGGATVASFQGVILLCLAWAVDVPYSVTLILGIFALQLLLAFSITAFGVMVAARIKQMQSFMGVMQMVVMPMFFISGALFPVANLPAWLAVLNRLDPLTYAVDPMRRLVFNHLDISRRGARRARSRRDLVGLARADAARGRDRARARPRDARHRDLGVQRQRVAWPDGAPRA